MGGYGAPLQYGAPLRNGSTMTVTGVDMNRDGIPDVLQQPQVGYGVPLQYGAPGSYGSTVTVTGVDMNRDGIPDVLQQPQSGYRAPVQYGAPVNYGSTMTVTGVDITGTAFQTCCNSLKLVTLLPCSMQRQPSTPSLPRPPRRRGVRAAEGLQGASQRKHLWRMCSLAIEGKLLSFEVADKCEPDNARFVGCGVEVSSGHDMA